MTDPEIRIAADAVLDILALLSNVDLKGFAEHAAEMASAMGMEDGKVRFFVDVVEVLIATQHQLRGLAPHADLYRTASIPPTG